MTKQHTLWLSVLIMAALCAGSRPAPAQDSMKQPNRKTGTDSGMLVPRMCKMQMQHMENMAEINKILAEAKNAASAGQAEKAASQIEKAQMLMDEHHRQMHQQMNQMMQGKQGAQMRESMKDKKCPLCGKMMDAQQQAAVINKRCPIKGTQIDQENVPERLTRNYKGQKIGFCCAECPAAWDKLSDEEKQQKLKAASGEQ